MVIWGYGYVGFIEPGIYGCYGILDSNYVGFMEPWVWLYGLNCALGTVIWNLGFSTRVLWDFRCIYVGFMEPWVWLYRFYGIISGYMGS